MSLFKTCISETKANQIIEHFHRKYKMNFVRDPSSPHRVSKQLKSTLTSKRTQEAINNRAKLLAERMLMFSHDNFPIHVELSWRSDKVMHAMALIFFPTTGGICVPD